MMYLKCKNQHENVPREVWASAGNQIYDPENSEEEAGEGSYVFLPQYEQKSRNVSEKMMRREIVSMQVRCSPQLKARIREAAFEYRRSQNQLIVDILEASLNGAILNRVSNRLMHSHCKEEQP
jgi:hypothetical protein